MLTLARKPTTEYTFNQENIKKYIDIVTKNNNQKEALETFFDVSKYICFDEFKDGIKCIVSNFKIKQYAACLFTIDYNSVNYKSNFWVYQLLIEYGLSLPNIFIYDKEDVIT